MPIPLLLIPLLCLTIVTAEASPVASCHCFSDRDFDPTRPAAADDYFLAAAQNSFFAAVSGIDKETVVRAKMSGADGRELWLRWYVTRIGGGAENKVITARQQGLSWSKVVEHLQIPPDRFAPAFTKALLAEAGDSILASQVVDAVLATRCRISLTALQTLRQAGAGDQEAILAFVLAAQEGRPARDYYQDVKNAMKSWGALLSKARIDAGGLDRAVRGLLVQ